MLMLVLMLMLEKGFLHALFQSCLIHAGEKEKGKKKTY